VSADLNIGENKAEMFLSASIYFWLWLWFGFRFGF